MPQVYMGFMDEEVNDILNLLLANAGKEGRDVVIFERGDPSSFKGELFERKIQRYGIRDDKRIGAVPVSAYEMTKVNRLDKQKRNVTRTVIKWDRHALKRWYGYAYDRQIKTKDQVCMVTVRPEKAMAKLEPIILVRSPEMGLQPDMTRYYLVTVFNKIGQLFEGADIRISCFGAGGAIDKSLRPGQVNDVCGSFYVGAEVARERQLLEREEDYEDRLLEFDPSKTKQSWEDYSKDVEKDYVGVKYYAVVQLILDANIAKRMAKTKPHLKRLLASGHLEPEGDPDELYTYDIFRSRRLYKLNDALEIAKEAFKYICQQAPRRDPYGEFTKSKRFELRNKYKLLNGIVGEFPACSINLTGSYFIGSDMKDAARTLKLGDANMEDYHVMWVLNVMGSKPEVYGKLRGAQITRVHCDPYDCRPIIRNFIEWAKTATYSREKYQQAILWGLKGCMIGDLPKIAHWDFATYAKGKGHNVDNYFYKCKVGPFKGFVLDPFFSEIASDFLKTVVGDRDDKPAFRGQGKIMKNPDRHLIKNLAAGILQKPEQDFDTSVGAILDILENDKRYQPEGSFFKAEKPGELKIWVRPGKWENQSTLLNEVKWNLEQNIDRALYKSANQILLQELAPTRVPRRRN